ncbi:MAG: large subunit ribosomal protein L35 [Candidatus Omnitrophota bacterium]|jgi:large subunit ribosomal protein L35
MRKTKKAVSGRFKLTKSGGIKRSRAGKSHLMTSKSRKRKRSIRQGCMVDPVDEPRLRRLLPHG